MTNEEIGLQEFNYAIESMLNSKYILIDRKISDILHAVVDSKAVYNVIARAMINFDFVYEWKLATQNKSFIDFPEDRSKRIAFIFCLLNNMDNRNIDATYLLESFFSFNTPFKPYELFCKMVIEEFRALIFDELGIKFEPEIEENEIEKQENIESMLLKNIDELKKIIETGKVKSDLSKAEILAVLSALSQAITHCHTEYLFAFVVMLKSVLKKQKNVKFLVQTIFDKTIEFVKGSK